MHQHDAATLARINKARIKYAMRSRSRPKQRWDETTLSWLK